MKKNDTKRKKDNLMECTLPIFEMITISVFVIILFGAVMAWAGFQMGYAQRRIEEEDKKM